MPTTCLSGEFDLSNTSDMGEQLRSAVRFGSKSQVLVVDCTRLTFMSASGLRVLVEVDEALRANGGCLTLVQVPPSVRRIIEIAGLTDLIDLPRATGADRGQERRTANGDR
jgi:anti-anti-sigma factor